MNSVMIALKINMTRNKSLLKKLLFKDTDSLIYKIKNKDVFEDFSSDKEMFDISNQLTKSKYYDNSNKQSLET